jgi:hypothetical protein
MEIKLDREKHDELVELAWRYAAIIGVVNYEDLDITDEEIAADRKRWADLIEEVDGLRNFDDLKAAGFMAELSGATLDECLTVVREEWGGPE